MVNRKLRKTDPAVYNSAYRSFYRADVVADSINNHIQQVENALCKIYNNPELTPNDFKKSFLSKLLSDNLVTICNIQSNPKGKKFNKLETRLKLTKLGCQRIKKPFIL